MANKFLKRAISCAAIVCVAGFSASFFGCSTRSTARIEIEFNEVSYVLEYELYKNMYPQTVKHFTELADSEFYNNTIIHNYTSTDWYGGGYSYNEAADVDYESDHKNTEYFENNSKEKEYDDLYRAGKLTPTVFLPGITADLCNFENSVSTLIGEFENNNHVIEKGAPTTQKGALRMYYTEKTTTEKTYILTGQNQYLEHDYRYNSATSLFAMQVNSSSTLSNKNYALFGVLKSDDDKETLNDLISAVKKYSENNYTDSEFITKVEGISINNYEEVSTADKGADASYSVPDKPIIIRTIKITKY